MPVSDTETFRRMQGGLSAGLGMRLGPSRFVGLDTWARGALPPGANPEAVSLAELRRMDVDPVVYLAEWAITSLIKRPDLYYVSHPDPSGRMVSEVEEWLWPLLPKLLPIIARAFSYGAAPYVLDWAQEDLTIRGKSGRRKRLAGHLHYAGVHELWPGDVKLETEDDELLAIHYGQKAYGPGRGRLAVWGRQFGEWRGQSARRRAWKYSTLKGIHETLRAQYLEKSVDPPRIVYCSTDADVVNEGGEAENFADHLGMVVGSLRNNGVGILPGNRDDSGNRMVDLEVMNLPDRSTVFPAAIEDFNSQIIQAFLVPPAMAGIDDSLGSGGRILDKLFSNMIENLAGWVAVELSAIVEEVHSRNHPASAIVPEVGAYRIPDKVQKLYLETLRAMGEGSRLGERVDARSLLDQLGIPLLPEQPERATSPEVREPAAKPGPERDTSSDREERREDAATEQGEEDTGAPRDEDGEPLPSQASEPAKEEETATAGAPIFGYHLQAGVVTLNEARAAIGLPALPFGSMTVPEYLASLREEGAAPSEEEEAAILSALGLGSLEG